MPGSESAHYAPTTPLRIVPADEIEELAALLSQGGQRIAVLAQRPPLGTYQFVTWINAGIAARGLRARSVRPSARRSIRPAQPRILVQAVPAEERWDAVRDRLRRAAAAERRATAMRRPMTRWRYGILP